jgi:hypothetical protein
MVVKLLNDVNRGFLNSVAGRGLIQLRIDAQRAYVVVFLH